MLWIEIETLVQPSELTRLTIAIGRIKWPISIATSLLDNFKYIHIYTIHIYSTFSLRGLRTTSQRRKMTPWLDHMTKTIQNQFFPLLIVSFLEKERKKKEGKREKKKSKKKKEHKKCNILPLQQRPNDWINSVEDGSPAMIHTLSFFLSHTHTYTHMYTYTQMHTH